MTVEPAFDLDDLDPAEPDSAQAERSLWAGDLTVLVQHRTAPHGSHSYVLAHDTSATWGAPGAPQLVAIKIDRDFGRHTFTLESTYHASIPFAQAWLIERGCPPGQIAVPDGMFSDPADDLTLQIEQKIREAGKRYDVLDTYTQDREPYESWTLVRDRAADQAPIRVFLEQEDPQALAYTLREGAFPDQTTAQGWLNNRSSPLPPAPEDHLDTEAVRTRVALARSAGAPRTACGLDTLPTLSTSAVPEQGPRWSR